MKMNDLWRELILMRIFMKPILCSSHKIHFLLKKKIEIFSQLRKNQWHQLVPAIRAFNETNASQNIWKTKYKLQFYTSLAKCSLKYNIFHRFYELISFESLKLRILGQNAFWIFTHAHILLAFSFPILCS